MALRNQVPSELTEEGVPRGKVAAEQWIWHEDKDPPFHRRSIHDTVKKWYSSLFFEGEKGRVFVPLCGKSLDMIFFADAGHEVVGVEYSEIGVEAFYKENNLTYAKSDLAPFVVYKTKEKNITIYRGDFFAVSKEIFGQYDVIWDRGSFVAINMDQRNQYTDIICPLMKPTAKCLLVGYSYDKSKLAGPPHYVTEESLDETFGRYCTYELLESVTGPAPEEFKNILDMWTVYTYLIKPKDA